MKILPLQKLLKHLQRLVVYSAPIYPYQSLFTCFSESLLHSEYDCSQVRGRFLDRFLPTYPADRFPIQKLYRQGSQTHQRCRFLITTFLFPRHGRYFADMAFYRIRICLTVQISLRSPFQLSHTTNYFYPNAFARRMTKLLARSIRLSSA